MAHGGSIWLWLWLWLGLAVVGSSACTPALDGPIDYRETGGLGFRGPAIHVEMDGTATRSHPDTPLVTVHLDLWTLTDLRHKIEDAGFTTLKPAYRLCKDCDYETVSVQLGGHVYTVTVYSGASSIPARLHAVLDTLRSLAEGGLRARAEPHPL